MTEQLLRDLIARAAAAESCDGDFRPAAIPLTAEELRRAGEPEDIAPGS